MAQLNGAWAIAATASPEPPGGRLFYLLRERLFAAAVILVGMLDAIRAEGSANGINNMSQFGSVKDPAGFKGLLEMSTHHQIRDGTAYPAAMFVHGLNDPRVDG